MNAVAGRRPETVRWSRSGSSRCGGAAGTSRPASGHGHQRGVGVAQLPVHDHRVLRPGVLPARIASSDWPRPGLERLAVRGVVLRAIPTASSRSGSPSSPTPARARRRSGATPTAGFRSVTLPRATARRSGCRPSVDRAHWEPIIQACVETDTVVSLHVGSSGLTPTTPRAGRRPVARRHPLRRDVADGLRGVAVVGLGGPLSRPQDRHVGGRHRLGGHAASTGSTTSSTVPATASAGTCGRPTCCGATSGSARSTTPRRSRPATRSGSTTSWSRSTIRTATGRGPTPRT